MNFTHFCADPGGGERGSGIGDSPLRPRQQLIPEPTPQQTRDPPSRNAEPQLENRESKATPRCGKVRRARDAAAGLVNHGLVGAVSVKVRKHGGPVCAVPCGVCVRSECALLEMKR